MTKWRQCLCCHKLRGMRDGQFVCICCVMATAAGLCDRLAEPASRTREEIKAEEDSA